MPGAITDLLDRVTDSTTGRPVISSLAAPGKALAATSINLADATNWTTTTAIHFSIFTTGTVGSSVVKDPTTQTDWKGTLAGTSVTNLVLTGGTDRTYTAGAIVEITPTARWAKDLYDNISAHANQDGSLKTAAVQQALNIGTTTPDWTVLATPPSSITHNGQRNYTVTIPGIDYTDRLNPGTRVRSTRTIAAPTQSTLLNGTSQYWVKTSPNKMAQTDNITIVQSFRATAYQQGYLQSKTATPGTDGWRVYLAADGTVNINANGRYSNSIQSVPLNKKVHVAVTLSMSTSTVNMYIDGLLVPSTALSGSGTSFTSAGNYAVGATSTGNAGTFFAGTIYQAAVFSGNLSELTIRNYMNQALIGNESNLLSAYSFNGNANDLNTTGPNDLTAQGGATATNADSFFGTTASGTISSTLDYFIVHTATFSGGNTALSLQAPEGCTIPTTGGVTTMSYSTAAKPFGFPSQKNKWRLEVPFVGANASTPGVNIWYQPQNLSITPPIGVFDVGYNVVSRAIAASGATFVVASVTLSTTTNSETDTRFTKLSATDGATSSMSTSGVLIATEQIAVTTPVAYYLIAKTNTNGTMGNTNGFVSNGVHKIIADNALL